MVQGLSAGQKRQLLDLVRKVMQHAIDGTRSFDDVCDGLESIIDDTTLDRVVKAPVRSATPDELIDTVSAFLEQYGGGQQGYQPSDIPEVPNFTPWGNNSKKKLLLAVYLPAKGRVSGLARTVDAWWDFIVPPTGITKHRWEELKSDSQHLRLVPGVKCNPGIRWVAFDPSAYQGKSPKYAIAQSAIDGTALAHAEVLMAAAQLPQWVSSWDGVESPYPNMTALQFCLNNRWSHTPYLNRSSTGVRLTLDAYDTLSSVRASYWASPLVEVLKNGS